MKIKEKILYLQERYEKYKPQIQTKQTFLDDYYSYSAPPAAHLC